MSEPIRDPELTREQVEDMLRRTLAEYGLTDPASWRDLQLRGPELFTEQLTEKQLERAKTFYIDGKGWLHRITEMPNGYLHNALAALKRGRVEGLQVFTVLAMDAEVKRREESQDA